MGARWVEVDPERLPRWLAGFAERHGPSTMDIDGYAISLRAADGETATCHAPPGAPAPAAPVDLDAFVAAARAPRRLGLLLVRRGGFAVGVAAGTELVVSKVDSRYVQSRTAAGGWSQQRFARRRDNQARALAEEVADTAVRLLVPEAGRLDALVAGGDRRLVDTVLADPRLAVLARLRAERFLDVPDPKLAVLQAAVRAARAVRIRLDQPPDPKVSQAFGLPVA
jgi:Actinobacteria/chloroflexi VLRF1 release factor